MQESLEFVFDNERSSDMGVIQVATNSGLFTEQFVANKSIREEKVPGNDIPYFYGVEREPLSFPLKLWFEGGFDEEKIRKISRWIDQQFYKPFYTVSNPNRIFYCMSVDSSEHIHNGIKDGFLQLNMRCNSPYVYSKVYTETHDFRANTVNGTDLKFINQGDIETKPLITVQMLEDGDFSIVNLSDGGKELKFTGLKNGEIVTVNNQLEDIKTSLPNTYRFDNFSDNYTSFIRGHNHLKVYGKAILTIKFHFIRQV